MVTAAHMIRFKPGETVEAVLWVRNTGKTRAQEATIYQRIVSVYKPLTHFPIGQVSPLGVTLPPNVDVSAKISGGPIPLPLEEFERIKSGEMFVYMYGLIGYKDIFGQPHHTNFTLRYNPASTDFELLPGYNSAD
jgi:hypothetical protein